MLNQDEIIKAQQARQNTILSGFSGVREVKEIEMTKESFEKARVDTNLEVYDLDGLNTFKSNIRKASENGSLSEEDLQKAELGLGRLIKVVIVDDIEKGIGTGLMKKFITDKNGKKMTVWVRPGEAHKTPEHGTKKEESKVETTGMQQRNDLKNVKDFEKELKSRHGEHTSKFGSGIVDYKKGDVKIGQYDEDSKHTYIATTKDSHDEKGNPKKEETKKETQESTEKEYSIKYVEDKKSEPKIYKVKAKDNDEAMKKFKATGTKHIAASTSEPDKQEGDKGHKLDKEIDSDLGDVVREWSGDHIKDEHIASVISTLEKKDIKSSDFSIAGSTYKNQEQEGDAINNKQDKLFDKVGKVEGLKDSVVKDILWGLIQAKKNGAKIETNEKEAKKTKEKDDNKQEPKESKSQEMYRRTGKTAYERLHPKD